MSQAVQWSAPIIIGVFLVAEQVAFFSVAQRIALLTSFILMAVNLVVAPKFSAFHTKGDEHGIRKTALFSVRLLVLTALPVVLFMLAFPEFLMGLFGEEFRQGALILQILVLGQAVNVVTGSVGLLLQMTGHERDMRLVTLISGFGVLISVPIFTKLFGAVGAASATAFFISLQNLLAVYFVKKRLGFNTLMFWQKI
ncbi:MATE family efflux transporter [Pseudoalteromonas sp. Hal056]